MRFLIVRPDNIGDVVLTFAIPALLKAHYGEQAQIIYLTREYTKAVVDAFPAIDEWASYDELKKLSEPDAIKFIKNLCADVYIPLRQDEYLTRLAYKAGIPIRLGHIYRTYFLRYSNRLIFRFKRKKCEHHQAQTELQYFKALNLRSQYSREELQKIIRLEPKPFESVDKFLSDKVFHLVVHPGNNGNTIAWSKENFAKLISMVPPSVKIYITGSAKEKDTFGELLNAHPNTVDLFGKMPLDEYLYFLSKVNGLLVGSTGPLHLAAALNTPVIGLFPPHADMNVMRWGALSERAINIEAAPCEHYEKEIRCQDLHTVSPEQVYGVMQKEWGMS